MTKFITFYNDLFKIKVLMQDTVHNREVNVAKD